MLRIFLLRVLLLPFVASCVMLAGKRTATTTISSTPEGASVYAVHKEKIHDTIYEGKPAGKDEKGNTITFQGVTPMLIEVPKGMNTQVIVMKDGYKTTKFQVSANKEAAYYGGQNKTCATDRYYSWFWSAGIVDEVINGYILGDLRKDYCKDIRHSYHVKLELTSTAKP